MLVARLGHHRGVIAMHEGGTAMELTDQERNLLLSGLYHLSNVQDEDPENVRQIDELVEKLGGDPDAMFFLLEHG
jgi:hypothetical protein